MDFACLLKGVEAFLRACESDLLRVPPTIYEALERLDFIFYLQTAGIIQKYKILGPNVDQVVSWQVSRILVWA